MSDTLDRLKAGQAARVCAIDAGHALRQRLSDLGLHPGDILEVLRTGFLGGPVLLRLVCDLPGPDGRVSDSQGSTFALGQGEARKILVELVSSPECGEP